MRFIGSLLFNIYFYLGTILFSAFVSILCLLPSPKPLQKAIHFWMKATLAGARLLFGLKVEYRGRENVPAGGVILCSKHATILDAVLLYNTFPTITALAKKELKHMPFVGWLLDKIGCIWIDRGSGTAHVGLDDSVRALEAAGRPIIVYPEGTRVKVGDRLKPKPGVYFLQKDSTIPVIPVATNAGVFWPKGKFLRYGGTVVMEFAAPLSKELERAGFMRKVEEQVVDRSETLMREADITGRNLFLEHEARQNG